MLGASRIQRQECAVLLRSGNVGRVALTTPGGPHITAIEYAVLDTAILMRTSTYSMLGTFGRDAALAFEVDAFDDQGQGWSVVAEGQSEVVTDLGALAEIRRLWPPPAWSAGARHLVLRLASTRLTGRRTAAGPTAQA